MAVTKEWDETSPANTDDPRDGALNIRDLTQAVRERVRNGGMHWETTPGTDTDAGKLCAGVQATNKLYFYETDKTEPMVTHDDNTKDVTLGDGIVGVNPYTLVVDEVQANTLTAGKDSADVTANAASTTIAAGVTNYDITANITMSEANAPVLVLVSVSFVASPATDHLERVFVDNDPIDTAAWTTRYGTYGVNDLDDHVTAVRTRHIGFTYLDTNVGSRSAGVQTNYRVGITADAGNSSTILLASYHIGLVEIV